MVCANFEFKFEVVRLGLFMPRKKRKRSAHAELPFAKFKPTVKAETDNEGFSSIDNAGMNDNTVFKSAAKTMSPKEKTSEEFEVNRVKRSFFNEVMSNMGGFGESSRNNSPSIPMETTKSAATSVVSDLLPSLMHTTTRDACTQYSREGWLEFPCV